MIFRGVFADVVSVSLISVKQLSMFISFSILNFPEFPGFLWFIDLSDDCDVVGGNKNDGTTHFCQEFCALNNVSLNLSVPKIRNSCKSQVMNEFTNRIRDCIGNITKMKEFIHIYEDTFFVRNFEHKKTVS